MKVARKHIIAAIDNDRILIHYPKYSIKAYSYKNKDKKVGEFGWTIAVLPRK